MKIGPVVSGYRRISICFRRFGELKQSFFRSVRAKTHHGENSRNSLGANGNFLHGPPPLMFPPRLPPPPISQLNQNLSVPLQQQQQQQQQNIIEQQHLQAPYCGESLQMEVEEEKQKPEPTLSERLILLRKRDIGCDVNFVIGSEPNVKVIFRYQIIFLNRNVLYFNQVK